MFPELQCPTKCAVGMIRREVSCSRIDESGNLTIIDPEFCRYMNKPLSEMKCNENKPCGCKLLYFVLVSRRRKRKLFQRYQNNIRLYFLAQRDHPPALPLDITARMEEAVNRIHQVTSAFVTRDLLASSAKVSVHEPSGLRCWSLSRLLKYEITRTMSRW